MRDFSKAYIYKLVSNKTNKIYIGSSCDDVKKRYSNHKNQNCLCSSKILFELGDVEIKIIEYYPCSNEDELYKREQFYLDKYKNIIVNKKKAFIFDNDKEITEEKKIYQKKYSKKYREENKEKIKIKDKLYYQQNKEKIKKYYQQNKITLLEQHKKYREENKEDIKKKKKLYRQKKKEDFKIYAKKRNEYMKSWGGNISSCNNSLLKIDVNLFTN